MSDKEFDVKIVTPDKIFFDSKGTMVEFNTTEGEIGVYPEHIPLTTIIAPISYTHLTLPTTERV